MMMNKDMLFHHQQQQVEENMSNLTSASGDQASVSSGNRTETSGSNFQYNINPNQQQEEQCPAPQKKKRNQPGNPDPDAEVMALSPKTLMATNRFICEICNKGFQRDQNLQLHKRGHNLPWKLKQRSNKDVIRKKVYVCPEPSCVHHHPSRALGDLTGIKKHFFRKHGEKKWKCDKCSKKYAVQSDWKAHAKTCGTKEYKCDCGTLFSRRDSFITHRAFCDALAEESARAIPNPILIQSSSPHDHQTQHNINFSSSSQNITSNNNNIHAHELPTKQEEPHHQFHNIPPWLISSNPNPSGNNANYFPLASSSASFHHSSPAMSATALLQKAAQMGHSKPTTTPEEEEERAASLMTTTTMAASMMTSPSEHGFGFQDYYMMNHHPHHHHGVGEAFNGGFIAGDEKNDVGDDGGGETRDFLGLRSLMSHNEILSFANNLGNCINTSASEQQQRFSHQD
ncbi:protein indeterminate-domain 7 isoform X1 [Raphanus sativus]|uniref:Protein indeterminate-domain 7 isoform X1 n=2 Tax=Raphanus sativus TaxID=3726 RepID=A0A6J0KVM0_RAPSA|nr:protein indeterminate-domain 7 isoform X1 [Raphanus sativus]